MARMIIGIGQDFSADENGFTRNVAISFEGCGCCSESVNVEEVNRENVIASIIRMRNVISRVCMEMGISEDEIRGVESKK